MPRMLRVEANTTFNAHTRGDVLLVEETADIKRDVKAGYWKVLKVEDDGKAKADDAPAKAKPKARVAKADV